MLSKTNNVTHANDINPLSQENQDYNNQHNQQLMKSKYDGSQGYCNLSDPQFNAHKHIGGVERVNTELVPDSVLKEKEEWFYQWADNYEVWDNNPYRTTKGYEMGGSHIFNVVTSVFSITKPNITGNRKQEL